jgi:hypothetical protein
MAVTHLPAGTPLQPGNPLASGAIIAIGTPKSATKPANSKKPTLDFGVPDFWQRYCDVVNAEIARRFPDLSFDDALLAITQWNDAMDDAMTRQLFADNPGDPLSKYQSIGTADKPTA